MFNLDDLDNLPPKKRKRIIRLFILAMCLITTLGGVLFSMLTW